MLFFVSCKENSQLRQETADNDCCDDGSYCAKVRYENPKNGFSNDYLLKVEVSKNKLVRINFANGGWLDESHFNPSAINKDLSTSFTTDKGVKFTCQIVKQDNCILSSSIPDSDERQYEEQTFVTTTKYVVLIVEGVSTYTKKTEERYIGGESEIESLIREVESINKGSILPPDLSQRQGTYIPPHSFTVSKPIKRSILVSMNLHSNKFSGSMDSYSGNLIDLKLIAFANDIKFREEEAYISQLNISRPVVEFYKKYYKIFSNLTEAQIFYDSLNMVQKHQ